MPRPPETRPELALTFSDDPEHALEMFGSEKSPREKQTNGMDALLSNHQIEPKGGAAAVELGMKPPTRSRVEPAPRLTLSEEPLFTRVSSESANFDLRGQGPLGRSIRSRWYVWPLLSAVVAIFLVSWFAFGGTSSRGAAIDGLLRLRAVMGAMAAARPASDEARRTQPKATSPDADQAIVMSGASAVAASPVPSAVQSPSATPNETRHVPESTDTPSAQAPVPASPVSQPASPGLRAAPVKSAASSKPRVPAATVRELAGTLTIDSRPVGASVFIDDRLVGTTPMLLSEISPGTHVIRLQLGGHRDWKSTVQIVGDLPNRVTAGLEEDENLPPARP
jgi:hypothetical protein